jgi:hypothetical protein
LPQAYKLAHRFRIRQKAQFKADKLETAKIMAELGKIVAAKKLWKISETGYSSRTTLFSHFLPLSA